MELQLELELGPDLPETELELTVELTETADLERLPESELEIKPGPEPENLLAWPG